MNTQKLSKTDQYIKRIDNLKGLIKHHPWESKKESDRAKNELISIMEEFIGHIDSLPDP